MTDVTGTEEGSALDVLSDHPGAVIVTSPSAWRPFEGRLDDRRPRFATSLEEIALERLWAEAFPAASGEAADPGAGESAAAVIGLGGGVVMDAAKDLALRTGAELVLVPTTLSSLAPFTVDVARRARRQVRWAGEVDARVVLDLGLIAQAPPERNRAGAAELVATLPAIWDWRLADARGVGLPLSARLVELAERCRRELGAAAESVAAASVEGLRTLADLLAALGAGCARAGLRLPIDGSAHTFVEAYEHRLGPHPSHGGLLGLGTVAMATLQALFGLAAGGPVDPDEAIALLSRCQVAANPAQLGLDEGTFRGVLRHTVRYAVGESLPYSVLNEADVNWSTSEEMWRQAWRVPRVR